MPSRFSKRARVYDADIYAFERAPGHYWAVTSAVPAPRVSPPTGDIACDVAIIGGGYAGLSAAYRLCSEHHLSATVLEAGGTIGWGASGMNGGFVSMGGAHISAGEMVRRVGEVETRHYWKSQTQAVEDVRSIIAHAGLEKIKTPEGNLCVAHHPRVAAALAEEAQTLKDRFGVSATFLSAERFRQEIHDGPETFGALDVQPGFGIHPMDYVRALAQRTLAAGAQVYIGAEAASLEKQGANYLIRTRTGATVRANRIIVATNAYLPDELDLALAQRGLPAISSIIVTQPYERDELEVRGFRSNIPIYNGRHILSYYRRLPDGRILFGGRGDTTGSPLAAAKQEQRTLARLKRMLPAFTDARIDHSWRGLVCLTARRTASIGLVPGRPGIAYAFGCHGSGIATMTWAGRVAADLVAKRTTEDELPAIFRGLPPRLPRSPALRRWGLRMAYAGYAARDALNI